MKKITIFGDGNCSTDSLRYKLAFEVGAILGRQGISIVNGGYGGVMEASFKGASNYAVERIAIVTTEFKKPISQFATKIINTQSYLERLEKLIKEGEMYIFFEGGSGTLLEIFAYTALLKRQLSNKKAICIGQLWVDFFKFLETTFEIKITGQPIYYVQTLIEFETVLENLLI
ncbi:MAG: SLOG cluster 4 domain-containing protein [Candidatus Kapaibacteriales bacterium]